MKMVQCLQEMEREREWLENIPWTPTQIEEQVRVVVGHRRSGHPEWSRQALRLCQMMTSTPLAPGEPALVRLARRLAFALRPGPKREVAWQVYELIEQELGCE